MRRRRVVTKSPRFPKAAVICHSISALVILTMLVFAYLSSALSSFLQLEYTEPNVLLYLPGLLAEGFIIFVLATKRRDILTVIAFAIPLLSNFIGYFSRGASGNDISGLFFGFSVFSFIVSTVSGLLQVGIAACCILPRFNQHADMAKKLWLLPWCVGVIATIPSFFIMAGLFNFPTYSLYAIFITILTAIIMLPFMATGIFTACWLAYPYGYVKPDKRKQTSGIG